jgi:hypothetical protein
VCPTSVHDFGLIRGTNFRTLNPAEPFRAGYALRKTGQRNMHSMKLLSQSSIAYPHTPLRQGILVGRANARSKEDWGAEKFDLNWAIFSGFVALRVPGIVSFVKSETFFAVLIYIAAVPMVVASFSLKSGLGDAVLLIIGAACLIRIIVKNAISFITIWEKPLGKIVYGVILSLLISVSSIFTDQSIRLTLQASASQFPTAQQAVFYYFFVQFVFLAAAIIAMLAALGPIVKEMATGWLTVTTRTFDIFGLAEVFAKRRRSRFLPLANSIGYICAALLIVFFVLKFERGFSLVDQNGNTYNPIEEIIVYSSFVPNSKTETDDFSEEYGPSSQTTICRNLSPSYYISIAGSELLSKEVLVAEVRYEAAHRKRSRFRFRYSSCTNSHGPLP